MKKQNRLATKTSKLVALLGLTVAMFLSESKTAKADSTLGFATQNSYDVWITLPKGGKEMAGYKLYWGFGPDADNEVYPFSRDIGTNRTARLENMPLATNIAVSCSQYNEQGVENPKGKPAKIYCLKQNSLTWGTYSTTNTEKIVANSPCYLLTLEGPQNPCFFRGFQYSLDFTNKLGELKDVPTFWTFNSITNYSRNTVTTTFIIPALDVNPDPTNRNIFFRQKFPDLILTPPTGLKEK